jgi:O-antigen/teichoic acid export membrane protein
VALLYGVRFAPAVQALRWLAWMLIPYSLNICLSSHFLSEGEDRLVALAFLISLLFLAGLSAWWIPLWGLPGACLAALSAEVIQAGLFLVFRIKNPRTLKKMRS